MEDKREGVLMVLFEHGDYKKPIRPELKIWTIIFTYSELELNWNKLLARRNLIQKCLKERKVPLERGFEWECNECGFRDRLLNFSGMLARILLRKILWILHKKLCPDWK